MPEYQITWRVELEADDHEDAAKQAWGMLADATDRNAGASVLFVEGTDLTDGLMKTKVIDMEIVFDGR